MLKHTRDCFVPEPHSRSYWLILKYILLDISRRSFKWLQVTVTANIRGVYHVHVVLKRIWIQFHSIILKAVCDKSRLDFNTSRLSKQIYTVYSNSVLDLCHMCSILGVSTVDWLFHNIAMGWGSFCGIKENWHFSHKLNKGTNTPEVFLSCSLSSSHNFILQRLALLL